MIDGVVVLLLASQLLLFFVIALLIADNNRITREWHGAVVDAAWCRAVLHAFVGNVERKQ